CQRTLHSPVSARNQSKVDNSSGTTSMSITDNTSTRLMTTSVTKTGFVVVSSLGIDGSGRLARLNSPQRVSDAMSFELQKIRALINKFSGSLSESVHSEDRNGLGL